jgi:hypothetical protein
MMTQGESRTQRMRSAMLLIGVVGAVAVAAGACADVSTSPETPASLELSPFPWPSVVIGDTLRDANGVVAPVRAIVRNSRGDTLTNAGTTYLYADFNRDSALLVDSSTGIVVARKAVTAEARIAARVGGTLQAIRKLLVTVRPDTVFAGTTPSLLTTAFPDTGRAKASANTTGPMGVTVQNRQGTTPTGVNGWVVQFTLLRPANPTNDTTLSAWLVNEAGSASIIDTTDGGGNADRKVRVRANQFPTSGTDTVIVQATVTYKGRPVAGSGIRVRVPVRRGTP